MIINTFGLDKSYLQSWVLWKGRVPVFAKPQTREPGKPLAEHRCVRLRRAFSPEEAPFSDLRKGLATQRKAKTTFTFTHSLKSKRINRRLVKNEQIDQ